MVRGPGMQLQLENKVVVVTGGAKGIGAAIARGCGQEGAIPVIIDRDAEAGRAIEKELLTAKVNCQSIAADLCDLESCRRCVETIQDKYGRIDGLINNAGVNDRVGLEDGSPQQY